MKVRIKKCSDPLLWYNNNIGQIFTVVNEWKSGEGDWYYILENPDKRSTVKFLVHFNDCEKLF